MKPTSNQVDPLTLKPHPCNASIYGEEDVAELVEMIRSSGWVKPLICTPTGTIISGHRRWKAVLALGWESVPVEVREFSDSLAELEALLLENASRFKTAEQKVREAQAWKRVEEALAKKRMSEAGSKSAPGRPAGSQQKGVENFPPLSTSFTSGKTRDLIASRVGLGSGRTYSKAAKVVERIDALALEGNHEKAKALRQVLNERSVDAAHQLLKHISASNDYSAASLDKDSPNISNFRENAVAECQRSCWNCQYRGEPIDNHSFYCNRLGALNLIEKSAKARGAECSLWHDRYTTSPDTFGSRHHASKTFSLELPAHLQPLLQNAARSTGMSVVDWATKLLESEALATCSTTSCTETDAVQQIDKTGHSVNQYKSSSRFFPISPTASLDQGHADANSPRKSLDKNGQQFIRRISVSVADLYETAVHFCLPPL